MMRNLAERIAVAALLACASIAAGQTSSDAAMPGQVTRSDLPPSAIYTETLAPFEQTRADLANWSEVELAAFQATTERAKGECKRLEQTPHEAEEALALARLCSVGRDWDGTYSAARWYTRKSAPPGEAAHLELGFGLILQADLNLQAVTRAIDDLQEVLLRIPFSADVDSIFTYTVGALEIMRPELGIAAALLRQPLLLRIIAGDAEAASSPSPGQAEAEAWHALFLLKIAHRDGLDQEQIRLLDAKSRRKLPLSIQDQYLAAHARQEFEWIGKPMPEYRIVRTPLIKAGHISAAASAELLIIERAAASDVPALALGVESLRSRLPLGVRATLLLVGAPPVNREASASAPARAPAASFNTEDDLFDRFGMDQGPLFVFKSKQGAITYLGAGSSAWLNARAQAEILVERGLSDMPSPSK